MTCHLQYRVKDIQDSGLARFVIDPDEGRGCKGGNRRVLESLGITGLGNVEIPLPLVRI